VKSELLELLLLRVLCSLSLGSPSWLLLSSTVIVLEDFLLEWLALVQ
jgi:hypothetical protein